MREGPVLQGSAAAGVSAAAVWADGSREQAVEVEIEVQVLATSLKTHLFHIYLTL